MEVYGAKMPYEGILNGLEELLEGKARGGGGSDARGYADFRHTEDNSWVQEAHR